METQIHNVEQDAYSSVLRAFKAQSDAITWVSFTFCMHILEPSLINKVGLKAILDICFQEKESLITELRKELRVSDEEHRELLSKVNADDIILRIRYDYIATCLLSSFYCIDYDLLIRSAF